jgi:ATP-dependent DNA ligase
MLPARELILEGEIISARESGFTDFGALQDDLSKGRVERMVYYAFDLLFFDDFDLRHNGFSNAIRMAFGSRLLISKSKSTISR